MNILQALKSRRTIRKFLNKKIPRKILMKIIEAGTYAPSACNKQAWEFIIVDEEHIKRKLAEDAKFTFVKNIPAVIFVLYDCRINMEKFANIQSAAAAIQNMLLYSHSIGIGSWWIAGYGEEKKIREILEIPKNMILIAAVGFGYPAITPQTPPRRQVEEVIHIGKFEKKEITKNPEDWNIEEIKKFATRSIMATSPHIGYRYFFEHELKNLVDSITPEIEGENILSLFDCNGIEILKIAEKMQDKKFYSFVYSNEIANWLNKRANWLKIKNIKFINKTKLEKNKYDTALCLEIFNRLGLRKNILKEIYETLRPNGKLIVSVINSLSFHGIYAKKTLGHFGPEKTLSIGSVKNFLKENGFKIKKTTGLDLFPSKEILESQAGFSGETRLSRYHKIIRLVASEKLENIKTKGPLKNFCRLIIFYCRKS